MRYFVQIMAGCGIAIFLVGAVMKLQGIEWLMNTPPQGWWRGSLSFLAIGILYALIEIRDELRRRA